MLMNPEITWGNTEQVSFFDNSSFRRKPESSQNNCLLDAGFHRHDGKYTLAEFPWLHITVQTIFKKNFPCNLQLNI
jgi:hypothetical protein